MPSDRPVQVGLRVSPTLHARLVALAEAEQRSVNAQLVWMVERMLPELERAAGLTPPPPAAPGARRPATSNPRGSGGRRR